MGGLATIVGEEHSEDLAKAHLAECAPDPLIPSPTPASSSTGRDIPLFASEQPLAAEIPLLPLCSPCSPSTAVLRDHIKTCPDMAECCPFLHQSNAPVTGHTDSMMHFPISSKTLLIAAAILGVRATAEGSAVGAMPRWYGSSNINSYSSSSASKSCYGASGKPWDSNGSPGWYVGSGDAGDIPQWDNGDARWCNSARYAHSSFCRKGNPAGQAPANSANCWGANGHPGWPKPRPGKGGGSKTSTSTSASSPGNIGGPSSCQVATQTVIVQPSTVTVTRTAGGSVITSVITTTLTSVVVDVTTTTASTTTTATTTAVVPTGTPDPTCTDKYQKVFKNLTTIATSGIYSGQVVGVAVVANEYLTYGLADTPEQCLSICDEVDGCVFVNSYLDVEEDDKADPRHSGKYTCALYSACEGVDKGTNWGGQNDPNYITDSTGWCKTEACKNS